MSMSSLYYSHLILILINFIFLISSYKVWFNILNITYSSSSSFCYKIGRKILYACSWPAYQFQTRTPDWESIAEHCNLWRNYDDIFDSWASILGIIDYYVKYQDVFIKYHGPGHWFDPDMILVGKNFNK